LDSKLDVVIWVRSSNGNRTRFIDNVFLVHSVHSSRYVSVRVGIDETIDLDLYNGLIQILSILKPNYLKILQIY